MSSAESRIGAARRRRGGRQARPRLARPRPRSSPPPRSPASPTQATRRSRCSRSRGRSTPRSSARTAPGRDRGACGGRRRVDGAVVNALPRRWAARSSSPARRRPSSRAIERLFAERDRVFSRFRPDSELNRVNAGRAARRSSRRCSRALVAARARGRASRPAASSTRRSARRSSPPATTATSPSSTPTAAPAGARRAGLARRRALPAGCSLPGRGGRARPERRRQGARRSTTRSRCSPAPGFVSAGGDLAARGAVASRCRAAARSSSSRRARDERHRPAPLAARRRPQHHLIDPRPACRRDPVDAGDVAARLPRRGRRGEGGVPARRRRARLARRARAPGPVRRRDGEASRTGWRAA